jgi:adenosylcobinamide kinase / adenosylcobinamide-phosphate guanylyltransferase
MPETENFASGTFRAALTLGGARSGKSSAAERLAQATGARKTYIATAEARDAEMVARIARHRAERGDGWETVEAPRDLLGALRAADGEGRVIVVDCLTLWLSNRMLDGADPEADAEALCATLADMRAQIVCVSNEVGMGLVPDTPLGRAFRDAQGRLNQRVAAVCDLVLFMAAGLPLTLKAPR